MTLTPQERSLLSDVRCAETRWRIERWFAIGAAILGLGFSLLLTYPSAGFVQMIAVGMLAWIIRHDFVGHMQRGFPV